MRMRDRKSKGSNAEVMLSPLIDCVFLLLIFFLVSTTFKRFERQIPVTLADPSATVAMHSENDVVLLGIDTSGQIHEEDGRTKNGVIRFKPVSDLIAFSSGLADEHGVEQTVELVVERETPFQVVIDVLDTLQLQGFENVHSRVRDTEL